MLKVENAKKGMKVWFKSSEGKKYKAKVFLEKEDCKDYRSEKGMSYLLEFEDQYSGCHNAHEIRSLEIKEYIRSKGAMFYYINEESPYWHPDRVTLRETLTFRQALEIMEKQ